MHGICRKMYIGLSKDFDEKDAMACAERDWETDSLGKKVRRSYVMPTGARGMYTVPSTCVVARRATVPHG